jgi:hypothetical protein
MESNTDRKTSTQIDLTFSDGRKRYLNEEGGCPWRHELRFADIVHIQH